MPFRFWAHVCLLAVFAASAAAQTIGGCPVFPSNNIWNARVDSLPLHSRSAAWVNSIGPSAKLHPDFGAPYDDVQPGLPINLVNGSQPKVTININEGRYESDPGPYPFPPNAKVEGASDRHVLVVDTTNCMLYETFYSFKNADNSWNVYSGAIFDLRKNLLRPQFWTSADAAGLPIMPGLARYEEILEGEIKHALRFTAPRTTREFLWPARHFASSVNDPSLPSMGARFRLKADYDISSFSPTTRIILTALKRYGMMLADNGSSWYIQGTFDTRWPNLVDEWRRIQGSAFEAVDTSGLMESIDSAAVKGSTPSAPTLQSVALTPSTVNGGQGSTLRVSVSGPAPAGGVQVTLSSNNAPVAPVPASAQIAEGSSFVDLPLTTTNVASATTVTFTASLAGTSRQGTLTVNPSVSVSLSSTALAVSALTGGTNTTLQVTLSANATGSGAAVTLSSNNPGVAGIQGSVSIPAGSSTAQVPITTTAVGSATQVVFTASFGGVNRQATLTVNPPVLSTLSVSPSSVQGGTGATGTVTLSGKAPASGFAVALASANTAAATVPSSVQIAAGQSTVNFPITTKTVSSTATVQINASAQGRNASASLTVNASAPTAALSSVSAAMQGTSQVSVTVALSAPAGSSGAVVSLASNNSAVINLAGRQITVGAGATSATGTFTVTPGATDATVTISGSFNGVTRSASVFVPKAVSSGVVLQSLQAPSQSSAYWWGFATVQLSGNATSASPAPVVTYTGVVNGYMWAVPIAAGRSTLLLGFKASGPGTGSISVSYGGVTKSANVTFQ